MSYYETTAGTLANAAARAPAAPSHANRTSHANRAFALTRAHRHLDQAEDDDDLDFQLPPRRQKEPERWCSCLNVCGCVIA